MEPERTGHERFSEYVAYLTERFDASVLSELQDLSQWVVWRGELDEQGKKKKVPYNPHHHLARASVKLPSSWGTLEESLTALESGMYSGIGFMLTPPLVLVDLDNSYDKATQTITDPQAAEIVSALNSYTEASPGNGLHVLAYGDLPGKGIHTAIEMYGQGRFTTITTNHLANTPTTIEHRQDVLAALYHRFVPAHPPSLVNTRGGVARAEPRRIAPVPFPEPSVPEKPDEQVIQDGLAEERSNFARYFSGDATLWTGEQPLRKSKSEAVFVLILMLLTRTGDNGAQTKRLFRRSGLYDEKADARAGKDPTTGADVSHLDLAIYNAMRKRTRGQSPS